MQCCGSGMVILDLGSVFSSIPDPGFWISDAESRIQQEQKRGGQKKLFVILFFVAINFKTFTIILFLKSKRAPDHSSDNPNVRKYHIKYYQGAASGVSLQRRQCAWRWGRCRCCSGSCSRGRWGGPASGSPAHLPHGGFTSLADL